MSEGGPKGPGATGFPESTITIGDPAQAAEPPQLPLDELAAARLDAGRKMLADCIAWIDAMARDCGCTDRILKHLQHDEATIAGIVGAWPIARIVAPEEEEG